MKTIKFNLNTTSKIFKIGLKFLAFVLMCLYLAQLYVAYEIDNHQVFDAVPTYLMFLLRWMTIISVGGAVITPYFETKNAKFIVAVLAPVVGILNLIFLNANFIAWGSTAYAPWRGILFVIEQVFLIVIGLAYLVEMIVTKDFKNVKYYRIPIIIIGLMLAFFYQPMFHILFGEADEKAVDFSKAHLLMIAINFVFILVGYIVMHKRTMGEKKFFFAALALSGVFNFFYYPYTSLAALPFHLCNFAVAMMFIAFAFNLKGIFYFTYFVNVVGALFAMMMPDIYGDAYSLESVRFWYNHIYAFAIPILGVALKVYDRPNLKMMVKAIFWFTVYYLICIFMNAWFSNYADVNYFFINNNFFFEKLNVQPTMKDNYTFFIEYKGLIFQFYPLFHIVVYVVFIGLMFVMWFIYDAFYHISDSHRELHYKKKLLREGYINLKKELKGRSIKEPLYEEDIDMVEIKNFTKIYSGADKKAVDNLSLTVKNGEVYGFLGHNGAGKSTTIKSLVGIQSITSGKIIVEGFDVEKQPVEAKLRIGYVSDNHAVYERLTGREYINYVADLYMVSEEDRNERIDKYTKMFDLQNDIDREIKGYSHGMKQKLVVIASLIHDPKVWVLDEPLTGLDPTSSYQIKKCMREHAERGNIVFFSSHVIEVVEKVCDHICIINHGKLQCDYSIKELHEKGISLEELYMKYINIEGK